MNDSSIEQAIYGSEGAGGYRFLAKSPGFRDEWLSEAERLCIAFGEKPAAVACPVAVFAQPFGPQHVAVVQVADHGRDDANRSTLRFRLLIVPRKLYATLEGDPFLLADKFPPPQEGTTLPSLEWTAGTPPRRTVEQLQQVLDVPHSATLLGAAQALIDGGRVVFARSEPDATILRSVWALLPSTSRCELWPATFAFGGVEAFHVVAVPPALAPTEPHWIHEEQAGDYPEGRYELNLQIAVESGNQRDLDGLLARKTRVQMLQLAAAILAALLGVFLIPMALYLLNFGTPVTTAPAPAALELPPEKDCPPLSEAERKNLEQQLRTIGVRFKLELPGGASDKELANTLAELDRKLGDGLPGRVPGTLSHYGPLQRQLRVLLWKHNVPAYNERGLNTVELAEKLQEHLVKERQP